ncbi:hypothetical protein Vadar_022818 [Vaccinium darrowii]|uniref:Uncharacterized protein n=1 Tax=Vaccinium darrowii TaxID=229202 RepID=A0ACB7Z5N9_9ERIC|nr:hypothetical protein Vadar_022818 [Vaccinium darrowii]
MAQNIKHITHPIVLALILAIFSYSSQAHDHRQLKETNLTLYIHEFSGGPNATAAIVTGIPGKVWSYPSFGTIFLIDDPITTGLDMNSPEIARGQGIYVTSSLDGGKAHATVSVVFSDKKYNGSTLEIQGNSVQSSKIAEYAVVGGTGKFRFATGFVTLEVLFYDPTTFYSVSRCNFIVLHH